MQGYRITAEQAALISGKKFNKCTSFLPVQDINGDWFISEQEINDVTFEEFMWVKDLTPSEYVPPIITE